MDKTPSLESRIDATTGPFIEVGAVPSNPRGRDSLIDLDKIKKQLLLSNIYPPQTIETAYRHRITKEFKTITHRSDVPRSRLYRTTGQDFKTVRRANSWLEDPVNDKIDFIADATNLPVPDGTVGALYAIGLHPDAEPKFVSDEAPRSLEPGGVLVIDSIKLESLKAENPYLEVLTISRNEAGEITHYSAMRNNVPYQAPQVNADTTSPIS
jgi:hypothetical protein